MRTKQIGFDPAVPTKLDFLHDTQAIVQGDTEVTFFPRTTSLGRTEQNYEQNPFTPANLSHDVLAIGFFPTMPWMREAANINPNTILQALIAARVKLVIGNRNTVRELTFSQVADLSGVKFCSDVNYAAGAFDSTTQDLYWPPTGVVKLEEPIRIPAGQEFNPVLILDSSFALPTAAHWTTAAQGGALKLRCVLQVARKKTPSELTPIDAARMEA